MHYILNCHGRLLEIRNPLIMGIINLTPDSFYKESRALSPSHAVDRAGAMLNEGADLLDLGACSTRPGSTMPGFQEEADRLLEALVAIRKAFPDAFLSIDTWRSGIAELTLKEAQADIINDISGGLLDPEILNIAGKYQVPFILMHMQGTPENMQNNPHYENIIAEILSFFSQQTDRAIKAGIHDLILDPGFGFGKKTEQNFTLLNCLKDFKIAGFPLLAGVSRKSMIWKTLGTNPGESLNGTTVLNTIALMNGASILRVHDVKEAAETIKLFMACFPES